MHSTCQTLKKDLLLDHPQDDHRRGPKVAKKIPHSILSIFPKLQASSRSGWTFYFGPLCPPVAPAIIHQGHKEPIRSDDVLKPKPISDLRPNPAHVSTLTNEMHDRLMHSLIQRAHTAIHPSMAMQSISRPHFIFDDKPHEKTCTEGELRPSKPFGTMTVEARPVD